MDRALGVRQPRRRRAVRAVAGRAASTRWWRGCRRQLEAQGAGRVGRRIGFDIRTRRRCCWPASRCMSSPAAWATRTCRPPEHLWVGDRRRRAARARRLAASDGSWEQPYCCVATPSRPTSSTAAGPHPPGQRTASGGPSRWSFAGCASCLGDAPEWEGRFSRGQRRSARCWTFATFPSRCACEMLYAAWRLIDLGAAVQVGARARSFATCAER